MSTYKVTTQAEFDAAIKAHGNERHSEILIVSERGVWIEVGGHAGAYDSATVRAYGSATVRAHGSATVTAHGSATVTAHGSATVTAHGSATVTAYDSATVTAYGSATVTAYGSATVTASKFVAVHLHSARVTVSGGVVINVAELDLDDPVTWAAYSGVKVTGRGKAKVVHLFKAVDKDLNAGHQWTLTAYPVGQDVTAEDWRDDNECGGGLHASPHPHQALAYYTDAVRMLEVTAPLSEIRPIGGDKAKARTVHVVREVALDGEVLS